MGNISTENLEPLGGQPARVRNYDKQNPLELNKYEYMEMAYNGDKDFATGKILTPQVVESAEGYEERKELAYYRNFIKPIVKAMYSPVFNEPAKRVYNDGDSIEDANPLLNAFLNDADGRGNALDNVVQGLVEYGLVYGLIIPLVENYETVSGNEAENIDNRSFPYVTSIKPYAVHKCGLKDNGVSKWISYFIGYDTIDKKEVKIYRYYDDVVTYKFYYENHKGETRQILIPDSGVEHNLGITPYSIRYWSERQDLDIWEVHPDIWDMVRINTAIYNQDSELRRVYRKQGFSLFYAQGMMGDLTIAPDVYIDMNLEAKMPPGYTSPDPAIPAEIRGYLKELIDTLYQLGEQKGIVATNKVSEQSGVAKEWDFRALQTVITKVAQYADSIEYAIIDRWKKWTGQEFDYTVLYNRDYQPASLVQTIDNTMDYINTNPAPENERRARRIVANSYFAKYDPDYMSEAEANEEKYSFEQEQTGDLTDE